MRIKATRRGVKWAAAGAVWLAVLVAWEGWEAAAIAAVPSLFSGGMCFAFGYDGYLSRRKADGDSLLLLLGIGLALPVLSLMRASYLHGAGVGSIELAVPRAMGVTMLGGFIAGVWWARRRPDRTASGWLCPECQQYRATAFGNLCETCSTWWPADDD